MFIYILNLLNDGLKKKKNTCERLACEVIKDAMYISELTSINKNFNFEKINHEIVKVFEVLNKYSLSAKDSIEVLQKFVINDHDLPPIEEIYNNYYNSSSNEFRLSLESIIKDILENSKKDGENTKIENNCINFTSRNKFKIMSKKDVNMRLHKEFAKGYSNIEISAQSKEKISLVTDGITYAGYEIASETRKVEIGAVNAVL